jgi:type IV secretion system protein VirB6
MASQLDIFSWLFSEFDTVLDSYISSTASEIAAAITPVAWIMFGIYVVAWGISMIRGLIEEPVTDGLMRLVKIAVVLGIALNVGRYQEFAVDFFMDTPAALANVMAFGGGAASGDQSTYGMIDTLLNKTIDAAGAAWDQMSVLSPGQSMALGFTAILILIFGGFFTVAAGIMIIMAKVSMVLLLALGPLFILLLMFQATQRFFESWLGQVVNAMLTLVLLLAVCTMFFGITEQAINAASGVMENDPLQATAIVGVACAACTFLLFQVPPLASALGGGIALPVGGAAKALMGGGVIGTAKDMAVRAAIIKATGGAALAVKAAGTRLSGVGGLHRASNTISRG